MPGKPAYTPTLALQDIRVDESSQSATPGKSIKTPTLALVRRSGAGSPQL